MLCKDLSHLFDYIVNNFLIEDLDFVADIVNHIDLKCLQSVQKRLILL